MRIAIITGASYGLGREYARQLHTAFPEIEQVWLIARRRPLLDELGGELGIQSLSFPLDLSSDKDIESLARRLDEERPQVELLVNCAGCGYLSDVADTDSELLSRMIDLNIRALTLVTRVVLPYIMKGGHIINVSSIASFCPNARMTVYSSTKAYVSSFSLGLREEVRDRKISVTAICSGPMATEFLEIGGIAGNSDMFKSLPYCKPQAVAAGSYAAAKRDAAFYTPKIFFKLYRVLSKIIPHSILVKFVKT